MMEGQIDYLLTVIIAFGVLIMPEIEGIVRGGVIIPLKSLTELEGKKVRIKIVDVEDFDAEKLYAYLRLLREGKDAGELFEI